MYSILGKIFLEGNIMIQINLTDSLIWKLPDEIKPNTKVFAKRGVQGLILYNGVIFDHIFSGTEIVVNEKKIFESKNKGVFEIYGINVKKKIEEKWGTPSPVEYYDEEYGYILEVKCYGTCSFTISNARRLFDYLYSENIEFEQENMRKKIKDQLRMLIAEILKKICNKYKDKEKILAAYDEIKEEFWKRDEFFKLTYGISIEEVNIGGIVIDGTEEVDDKKKILAIEKQNTDIQNQKVKQSLGSVSVINQLSKALKSDGWQKKSKSNKKHDATVLAGGGWTSQTVRYCVNCGEPITSEFMFCPKCGSKQYE